MAIIEDLTKTHPLSSITIVHLFKRLAVCENNFVIICKLSRKTWTHKLQIAHS